MFITYEEYKKYGGGLDETAFNIYGYEAERRINAVTYGRIKAVTEPIGRCITRLADLMAKADVAEDRIASFSNDGVSQSFANISTADYESKADGIIRDYLANEVDETGVPLLYLGVD